MNTLHLPTERTLAITWGKWGGFYWLRGASHTRWRLCLGWVAITYVQDEFAALLRAYADSLDD